MKILTLETSCDETAAAVVTDDLQVLGSAVASQDKLHSRFGGVVPEIASRAHVERILPIIDQALRNGRVSLAEITAVAVVNTPGLAGSLLVGLAAAKALALALGVPLVAVNHLHAHLYACRMVWGSEVFPCVGLIVSGGHTNLYACRGPIEWELLGSTIDDAAGEAFDKVASMLGLGYPGGPAIQAAAMNGDPRAYSFPRSFRNEDRLEFSFSGLKTAVRYQIAGAGIPPAQSPALTPQQVADLAASFQEAVVDVLVEKAFAAVRRTGLPALCVGGGVAANARLRERLVDEAKRRHVRLYVAPVRLCTDNAEMAAIAVERLRAGLTEDLDLDAQPGLVRMEKR